MRDHIELCCAPPWVKDSYIRVHRKDGMGWPVELVITRKDTQIDLSIDILLRREQVVKLRDFLDSALNAEEAKE